MISPIIFLIGIIFTFVSCKKDETPGKVSVIFQQKVRDTNLAKDSMIYTNTAGNQYEVNELQYFISELTFWKAGTNYTIATENGIHYVDIDIASTLSWSPDQELPPGTYDSVSFVLGINETKNKPGLFVNPPERDMFWPDMMGGGYHYMKMNGKWKTPSGTFEPFNMHLGIGMKTDTLGNDEFIQNYFTVTLPLVDCYISGRQLFRILRLTMEVNSWFETPDTWDWNVTGGQIMQYQDLMHKAAINGKDAFSVEYESGNPE